MKFYFSSKGIKYPEHLLALIGKSKDVKVGLILNANDLKSPEDRLCKSNATMSEFESLSMKVNLIDLRNYSDSGIELKQALLGNDFIWVAGGSAFYLRYLMKKSGFDSVIRDVLADGIVYGGESAGAIVTGPSLSGFEVREPLDKIDEIIFQGLGLVDFTVLPHWGIDKFKDALEGVKRICDLESRNFQAISNNQILVLNEGDVRLIGE